MGFVKQLNIQKNGSVTSLFYSNNTNILLPFLFYFILLIALTVNILLMF